MLLPAKLSSSSRKRLNEKSKSKANAIGYEKRQARKANANISAADVYEHIPEKTKRSNVQPDLDREEGREFGENTDEVNQGQREAPRARLVGENIDDEEIPSEDDEEIESDAAFEESDEERFAGFFSSKKSRHGIKQKSHFAKVDLNEDEEMDPQEGETDEEDEEEVGDDDQFMNLVDVLDGKGEIDVGSDQEKNSQMQSDHLPFDGVIKANEEPQSDEHEGEDDRGVASDEEDEEKMAFAPSEDEEVPSALDQLQNFVSNLDVTAKKRKAPDEADGVERNERRTRKRRLLREQTEAGEENEFQVRSSGAKLILDDLLIPLVGQSSTLQSLKKTTKALAFSGSSKLKTLSAPLPQRAQERLDREAAYEQTKEEVDKWSETMKRIREAEHLSFPLQAQSSGKVSNLELNAKFKPTTDLERSVDKLLKASKLREEDIYETEETMLKMNKLSVEEIAERRNELRQMRELMFRAEIKARRVKKIKSKTYRRLKRKERERLGDLIDVKGPEDDSETEEGRMKREMERAKERATLRHKHTGKWAKRMMNREDVDEGARKDLEDMLSRGEKLRRRIQGVASDESDEESSEDEAIEGSNVEESIAKIKQGAFDDLAGLGDEDTQEGDGKKKGKSVFEMKFMKDAMARQAATVNKEVDDFTREMGGTVENDSEQEATEIPEKGSSNGVIAVRTGGRVVYRPIDSQSHVLSKTNSLGQPPSETSSVTLKSTDLLSPPPPSPSVKQLQSSASERVPQDVNPWLVRNEHLTGKVARSKNAVVVSKDSKALDKAKHRLDKQASNTQVERAKALDDAALQISLDKVLRLSTSLTSSNVQQDGNDSGEESEIEAQENILLTGKRKGKANRLAFQQRDLVALAFAGDNVVSSFEEAKRREIAADAPREVDTTIPGWGSWGGTGIRKAPPKPERIKVIPGVDPTTRADHGKKNIIISEKRDKKVAKYLVKDLPYPYTSKAQFERVMEVPLGVEWNTRVGFQRGTLPRVVKKPGVIIEPLLKLS